MADSYLADGTPQFDENKPGNQAADLNEVAGFISALKSRVLGMDLTPGGWSNAGSVHDFNSDFVTQVNRVAGIATLTLNAAPGKNGLSASPINSLIGVLSVGFRPGRPLAVVAPIFNGSWSGHTAHLQINTDGGVNVNYCSLGTITGDSAFISGSFSYRVA